MGDWHDDEEALLNERLDSEDGRRRVGRLEEEDYEEWSEGDYSRPRRHKHFSTFLRTVV